MSIKPTDSGRFAVNGSNIDATNISAPSSGLRDTGFPNNYIPPAGEFNYLENIHYRWQQWLSDGDCLFNTLSTAGMLTVGGQPLVYGPTVFTADHNLDTLIIAGHGLITGDGPLRLFNSGGALPTGLLSGTDYFAIFVDANTIRVAVNVSNAFDNVAHFFTTNGTGTHTIASTSNTTRPASSVLSGPVTMGPTNTHGSLSVNGSIVSAFDLTAGGALSVGGTMVATGATTLGSTLGVTGAALLSSTLGVTGATSVGGTLGVTGAATLSSTLTASGLVTANLGVNVATGQNLTLQGSADLKHGTRSVVTHASDFAHPKGSSTVVPYQRVLLGGTTPYHLNILDATTSGTGFDEITAAVPLRVGDIIGNITLALISYGSVPVNPAFIELWAAGFTGVPAVIASGSMTFPGTANVVGSFTLTVNHTIATAECCFVRVSTGDTSGTQGIGQFNVVYTH